MKKGVFITLIFILFLLNFVASEICDSTGSRCNGGNWEFCESPGGEWIVWEYCSPGTCVQDGGWVGCDKDLDGFTGWCIYPDDSLICGDCDDTNPYIYPGAPQPCGLGVDYNCDGDIAPCPFVPIEFLGQGPFGPLDPFNRTCNANFETTLRENLTEFVFEMGDLYYYQGRVASLDSLYFPSLEVYMDSSDDYLGAGERRDIEDENILWLENVTVILYEREQDGNIIKKYSRTNATGHFGSEFYWDKDFTIKGNGKLFSNPSSLASVISVSIDPKTAVQTNYSYPFYATFTQDLQNNPGGWGFETVIGLTKQDANLINLTQGFSETLFVYEGCAFNSTRTEIPQDTTFNKDYGNGTISLFENELLVAFYRDTTEEMNVLGVLEDPTSFLIPANTFEIKFYDPVDGYQLYPNNEITFQGNILGPRARDLSMNLNETQEALGDLLFWRLEENEWSLRGETLIDEGVARATSNTTSVYNFDWTRSSPEIILRYDYSVRHLHPCNSIPFSLTCVNPTTGISRSISRYLSPSFVYGTSQGYRLVQLGRNVDCVITFSNQEICPVGISGSIVTGENSFNTGGGISTKYLDVYNLVGDSVGQTSVNLNLASNVGFNVLSKTQTSVRGSGCPNDLTCNIYRNGVLVENPDIQTFNPGVYTYVYNTSGNEYYFPSSSSRSLVVSRRTTSLNLNSNLTWNFFYGSSMNISGLGCPSELQCNLYRDGNLVSNPDLEILPVGDYTYTYNTTGNINYSARSISNNLKINRFETSLYLNSEGDWWIISGETNVSGLGCPSELQCNLYRDGSLVSNPDVANLDDGTYEYVFNFSGNMNFSSDSVTRYLLVGPQATNLDLSVLPSSTISYGSLINVSGLGCPSEIECNLYRNGELVSNPDLEYLDSGNYTYAYNTTGDEGWSSFSIQRDVLVEKSSSNLNLFSNLGWNVEYGNFLNVSGLGCPSEIECNLYRDGELLALNEDSGILSSGNYIYTYNTSGNLNYLPFSVSGELVISKNENYYLLIDFDSTDPQYTLYRDGFPVNISCVSEIDVNFSLYLNDIEITDQNQQIVFLPSGYNEVICNVSESEDYSSMETFSTFEVLKQEVPFPEPLDSGRRVIGNYLGIETCVSQLNNAFNYFNVKENEQDSRAGLSIDPGFRFVYLNKTSGLNNEIYYVHDSSICSPNLIMNEIQSGNNFLSPVISSQRRKILYGEQNDSGYSTFWIYDIQNNTFDTDGYLVSPKQEIVSGIAPVFEEYFDGFYDISSYGDAAAISLENNLGGYSLNFFQSFNKSNLYNETEILFGTSDSEIREVRVLWQNGSYIDNSLTYVLGYQSNSHFSSGDFGGVRTEFFTVSFNSINNSIQDINFCQITNDSSSWRGVNSVPSVSLNEISQENVLSAMYYSAEYMVLNDGACPSLGEYSCVENLVNTSWSDWLDLDCFNLTHRNQSRFLTEYDSNNCGIFENNTHYEYQLIEDGTCYSCEESLVNTTKTDWYSITECLINDTILQEQNWTQYDENDCGTYENETFYDYQEIECNYCSYNVVNSSWGDWLDLDCFNLTHRNQSRFLTEYDENYSTCYLVTGLESDLWNNGENNTHYEYQFNEDGTCYSCEESLVNTTKTDWYSITECLINDTILQEQNWTQYDENDCGTYENETFYDYQEIECNYCSYNVVNSSWSDWLDLDCFNLTHRNQSRFLTEYDENYSTCYLVTGLESDLWNNGENNTHYEYQLNEDGTCYSGPPVFIFIPLNQSLIYLEDWEGVLFEAEGESVVFSINDTQNFEINSTGYLIWRDYLAVGNYYVNVTLNDTLDNLNSTIYNLNVTRANVSLNLFLDGEEENKTIQQGLSLNVTCFSSTSQGEINLYRNETLINSSSLVASDIGVLNEGYFNYTCIYPESQNYSLNSFSLFLNVTSLDITPPEIKLISPVQDFSTTSNSISFVFNVTDENEILNCSLNINSQNYLNQSFINESIENIITLSFEVGDYNWNISCVDSYENIGFSSSRDFSVVLDSSTVSSRSPGGTTGGVTCTPNCLNKVCGEDGCGGSCGDCEAGYSCSEGICVLVCVENWQCGEFSECVDGVKRRECIDLNNCNTIKNRPSLIQTCIFEEFTKEMSDLPGGKIFSVLVFSFLISILISSIVIVIMIIKKRLFYLSSPESQGYSLNTF